MLRVIKANFKRIKKTLNKFNFADFYEVSGMLKVLKILLLGCIYYSIVIQDKPHQIWPTAVYGNLMDLESILSVHQHKIK